MSERWNSCPQLETRPAFQHFLIRGGQRCNIFFHKKHKNSGGGALWWKILHQLPKFTQQRGGGRTLLPFFPLCSWFKRFVSVQWATQQEQQPWSPKCFSSFCSSPACTWVLHKVSGKDLICSITKRLEMESILINFNHALFVETHHFAGDFFSILHFELKNSKCFLFFGKILNYNPHSFFCCHKILVLFKQVYHRTLKCNVIGSTSRPLSCGNVLTGLKALF